eukprot:gene4888-6846_t
MKASYAIPILHLFMSFNCITLPGIVSSKISQDHPTLLSMKGCGIVKPNEANNNQQASSGIAEDSVKISLTASKKPTNNPTRSSSKTSKPSLAKTFKPSKTAKPTTMKPSFRQSLIPIWDISYHGGDVISTILTVHHLWYGEYDSTSNQVKLLQYFANNLAGSSWLNIHTTYKNQSGSPLKNGLIFGQNLFIPTTQVNLTNDFVVNLIASNLDNDILPIDTNAMYTFFFRGDLQFAVGEQYWLQQWCGYHYSFTYTAKTGNTYIIKYAVVGDASLSSTAGESGCTWPLLTTVPPPNGNRDHDSMVSVYAHELSETVTNPTGQGYYFDPDSGSGGQENADRCQWQRGPLLPGSNNANAVIGSKSFLIQTNWVYTPPTSGCYISYPILS